MTPEIRMKWVIYESDFKKNMGAEPLRQVVLLQKISRLLSPQHSER